MTNRTPSESYYVKGIKRNGANLLNRLLSDGFKRRECEWCGISTWNGLQAPLEVDHIDGSHTNNRIENLRILCPNCHAQTDTYKGKNIDSSRRRFPQSHICTSCYRNQVSRANLRCRKCAANARENKTKINWPEDKDLWILVQETNFSAAGKLLGVTDNAIRKRLKKGGLL